MAMIWKYEKFIGDMALYELCPKCGFYHRCGEFNGKTGEWEINYNYIYCPMCGEYLYDYDATEVEVIYNEREEPYEYIPDKS